VSALVVLGAGVGPGDAVAAGLRSLGGSLVLSDLHVAQAADRQSAAAGEAPAAGGQAAGDDVPFSELNEALTAARSRLAELTKAADIAKAAGELRQKLQAAEAENRQLKSVLSQLQTDFSALQSAKQQSDARIGELEAASQEAVAEARRLDEQLVSMRWQNSQLSSSLTQAETAARDHAGELAELRQSMGESTEDQAKLAKDLDATITELANVRGELTSTQKSLDEAKVALASAEQERGVLREQLAGNRSDADQLRDQLQTAKADLQQLGVQNAGLEQQVELLKAAAGEATHAARQNLIAVEDQINEINAALASVNADELLTGAGGQEVDAAEAVPSSVQPRPEQRPQPVARAADDGWVPRPSPPRAGVRQSVTPVTASEGAPEPIAQPVLAAGEANGVQPAAAINLASLGTELPAGDRQDAQALLGELEAEQGKRGLSMTVPGELLFAVNGEEIEPAAHDALASVAKLVTLYDARDVLIVGHTDAVGDAAYNQRLSERRAALVKQYFIDKFEISPDRLQIEGKGEQDPINSNATADGRNANRRVEVVILD
jgi:outer membrane protein OmpA-like peptidoglycan-associated protein